MARALELEPAAAPATILESEGTGRERRERGFHSSGSGLRKRRGTGSAPSSHGCGHWSSWGARLRQGERRPPVGAGGGGYRGAYLERNWLEMGW